MVTVSIVVPVYNNAKYLKQCLDSLINQTFKDIEIICINDGSKDNSLEILENYAKKDERIRVINKENQGQSIARNLGIQLAKGEYIGFVDSDDWADKEMFEKLYKNAKLYDSDIAMCSINVYDEFSQKYSTNDPYMTLDIFPSSFENHCFEPFQTFDFLFRICVVPWNKIYKREFLIKKQIEFPENLIYEDNVFCVETIIRAKILSIIKEPLIVYRKNSTTSYISSAKKDKKKLDVFKVFDIEEKVIKKSNDYYALKTYFKWHKIHSLSYWFKKIESPQVKFIYFLKLLIKAPFVLLLPIKEKLYARTLIKKLNLHKDKKIAFWGASIFLENILKSKKLEKDNIVAIIDKNESRRGDLIEGIKIILPSDLKNMQVDIIVPTILNIYNFEKIAQTEIDSLGLGCKVVKWD